MPKLKKYDSIDEKLLTYTNSAGLSLIINNDVNGYGIENILVNGKAVGTPKRGDMFTIAFSGLKPFNMGVRLPKLTERKTAKGIELDFEGELKTKYALLKCGLLIRINENSNVLEFNLRYKTDHDIAAQIEFYFHEAADKPQWQANLYPWAENSTSLPEDGIDDTMNRHPMVPSSRYQNHLFYYAGIPAALIRKPNRTMACLFGVAKDFEYGHPDQKDWRGGVNVELDPCQPIKLVSGVKAGYIRGGVDHEIPVQLVISDNADKYKQTYELLQSWCEVNEYTAEPKPHPVFKEEKEVLEFLIEKRKTTEFFFPDATYATDSHRLQRFGTYPANTGFNIYLDLYLGLKRNDKHWFERSATQIKWLSKMQIRQQGHVGNGLFCPVIPEGKYPGFYQHTEYEIEVNSLGAYWLLETLMLIKKNAGNPMLKILPPLENIEHLTFSILDGVMRHQQADGAIPLKVTDGGQYSEPVTPAHTINAFYLASKYSDDEKWAESSKLLENWVMDNCVEPLYFIGAHPDLQPKQYEEGSIHNVARYLLQRYDDTQDEKYLKLVIHLLSTAFFWRCPKQISWVDDPTQGCASEQTHFPQYSLYSYWCFKMLTHIRAAKASGLEFFENEARFLIKQSMHAVVMDGPWAGAYCERVADPWGSRAGDLLANSNRYLSELAPEYLYQIYELENYDA